MALNTGTFTLDNTSTSSVTTDTKGVRASDTYAGMCTFQVTGVTAGTATIIAQGTVDGTNYITMGVVPVGSTTMATSITADGIFRSDISGIKIFRLKVSGTGTGTTTATFFTTEG